MLALAPGRGMSIAEPPRISPDIETARTCSEIYAKTGARGHADPVRSIGRSVITIA
jgi:hypothetical protein